MTRKQIMSKIDSNRKQIDKLSKDNVKLFQQACLLNDKKSTYVEEVITRGRGKTKRDVLTGIVRYTDTFYDDDFTPPKAIKIERNKVVKEDGEWVDYILIK